MANKTRAKIILDLKKSSSISAFGISLFSDMIYHISYTEIYIYIYINDKVVYDLEHDRESD